MVWIKEVASWQSWNLMHMSKSVCFAISPVTLCTCCNQVLHIENMIVIALDPGCTSMYILLMFSIHVQSQPHELEWDVRKYPFYGTADSNYTPTQYSFKMHNIYSEFNGILLTNLNLIILSQTRWTKHTTEKLIIALSQNKTHESQSGSSTVFLW